MRDTGGGGGWGSTGFLGFDAEGEAGFGFVAAWLFGVGCDLAYWGDDVVEFAFDRRPEAGLVGEVAEPRAPPRLPLLPEPRGLLACGFC